MNYKDIRYKYYKDQMSYQSFRARHDIGKLPFCYQGYTTFLWKKYCPDISFTNFAKIVRLRGADNAIKVGHLGHGGDKNRGINSLLYSKK